MLFSRTKYDPSRGLPIADASSMGMRISSYAAVLGCLVPVVVASACGSESSAPATTNADAGASSDSSTALSALSYGMVYATVGNRLKIDGVDAYEFGTALTAASPPLDPCAASTLKVNGCCYLAAPPVVDAGPQTGPAGSNPDGGYTYVEESAGTLTLTDSTSNTPLATLTYGGFPYGFGSALGYPVDALNPTKWNDGDLLAVTATGASEQVGSFSATIAAVSAPDVASPSAVSRSTGVSLTWTPDPHAQKLTVTLSTQSLADGSVVCSLEDSAGKLDVDPSLFQAFQAGEQCFIDAQRESDQNIEVAGGHVTFATQALNELEVKVQ